MCQPSSLQAHQEWQQVAVLVGLFLAKWLPCNPPMPFRRDVWDCTLLCLYTPASILWLSFRQSGFFHDLEISIALATYREQSRQQIQYVLIRIHQKCFCVCVLAIAASNSGRNLHHEPISCAAYLVSSSTAGNVLCRTLLLEILAQIQEPCWPHSFLIP